MAIGIAAMVCALLFPGIRSSCMKESSPPSCLSEANQVAVQPVIVKKASIKRRPHYDRNSRTKHDRVHEEVSR